MSTIAWFLVIVIPSGYCMTPVEIKFHTESECETALRGVGADLAQFSKCVPRKEVK